MAIGVAAVVAAAYWSGGRVGEVKCLAANAASSGATQIAITEEIIDTKGAINAETYNTGVRDIRDRLRAKYTIRA